MLDRQFRDVMSLPPSQPNIRKILNDVLAGLVLVAALCFAAYSAISTCGTELWSEENRRQSAPVWIAWSAVSIVVGAISLWALVYLSRRMETTPDSAKGCRFAAIGCFALFAVMMGMILLSRVALLGSSARH